MRILCILLSSLALHAEMIRGEVELSGLKGEILLRSSAGGEPRTLEAGAALHEDEALSTSAEGGAELAFSNGLRLVLAPATTIRLAMFRQVKPTPRRPGRDRGEADGEASVVDLDLRGGRVVVVAPAMPARSLVSVRIPEGRMDIGQEGVYELSSERTPSGEWLSQTMVLAGLLKFSPVGGGRAKVVSVEAGNRLQVNSDLTVTGRMVVEKTKMDSSELAARLKRIEFDPEGDAPAVVLPAQPAPLPAPPPTAGSRTEVSRSADLVQRVTQQVVERAAQTNPSPTGG